MTVTMKVARSALPVTLAHWERAGVRETVMAAATYVLSGGADAMAVRHTGRGPYVLVRVCRKVPFVRMGGGDEPCPNTLFTPQSPWGISNDNMLVRTGFANIRHAA
jgi:hypothetical protein